MTPMTTDRWTVQQLHQHVGRQYGKYRATVTEPGRKYESDPENKGRIKARLLSVLHGEETGWALPSVPYAGNGVGLFATPPPGTGVWIEFEGGNIDFPIWSGCWWGDDQLPRDNSGTAVLPPLKIIRSEQGLMVTMNDSSQTITLSDQNGRNMLEIKVQQGKITIRGAVKAVVEAPQIELVENAAHPVVFGDQLMQYLNQLVALFNTHLHPGELAVGILPVTPAPPVPPFPPATPAMLSTRVKTG